MNRSFVTFIAAASFVIGLAICAPRVALAQKAAHRANELTLAGLRPGRDSYAEAAKKFGKPVGEDSGNSPTEASWTEPCTTRTLHIEANSSGVIQTIDVSAYPKSGPNCMARIAGPDRLVTGHGIRLGDLKSKVVSVYGKPGSVSPSTKDGRELELLYYAFDWAGADVPQVMEITCERATGRVVEILLAFPSL
jgi:hypothetical protein